MDVEAELVEFLVESGFAAFADVPAEEDKPDEFVTVERTGGARDSVVIDRATVAVQCWAPTRSAASALALRVDAAMPRLAERDAVTRIERLSLHNFPASAGEPRYQAVYNVAVVVEG